MKCEALANEEKKRRDHITEEKKQNIHHCLLLVFNSMLIRRKDQATHGSKCSDGKKAQERRTKTK